jgi:hypothetical protein
MTKKIKEPVRKRETENKARICEIRKEIGPPRPPSKRKKKKMVKSSINIE